MSKFETAEARPINLVHVAVLPPTVYPAPSIFYDWRQDDGYVCNPPCGKGVIEQIRNTLCYLLKVASSTHIRLLSGTTFLLSKKKKPISASILPDLSRALRCRRSRHVFYLFGSIDRVLASSAYGCRRMCHLWSSMKSSASCRRMIDCMLEASKNMKSGPNATFPEISPFSCSAQTFPCLCTYWTRMSPLVYPQSAIVPIPVQIDLNRNFNRFLHRAQASSQR